MFTSPNRDRPGYNDELEEVDTHDRIKKEGGDEMIPEIAAFSRNNNKKKRENEKELESVDMKERERKAREIKEMKEK